MLIPSFLWNLDNITLKSSVKNQKNTPHIVKHGVPDKQATSLLDTYISNPTETGTQVFAHECPLKQSSHQPRSTNKTPTSINGWTDTLIVVYTRQNITQQRKYWQGLQCSWTSKTCWEAIHKRPHIAWCHLQEISRIGDFRDRKQMGGWPRAGGTGYKE